MERTRAQAAAGTGHLSAQKVLNLGDQDGLRSEQMGVTPQVQQGRGL